MDTNFTVTPEGLVAAEWLKLAKVAFNNGEFFRAFDMAHLGLREHPGERSLAYRAVLSLANSGAIDKAAEKFGELGLDRVDSIDILCLRGRMAKDRGFTQMGGARADAFADAAGWYDRAYQLALACGSEEAYYPAINAASLALMAGNEAEAARRGEAVLGMLRERSVSACAGIGGDAYWVLATAIEARLLTRDLQGASDLVAPAIAASHDNQAELSSTWRQLERVLTALHLPKSTLARMAPMEVVHYLGHIIAPPGQDGRFRAEQEQEVAAAIEQQLGRLRIGAAYGALAAGADIMLAEALLKRGAALHVVLPFVKEEFIALSVQHAGAGWVRRFDACMERASSVRYATEDRHLGDDHLFAYGSQIAMGLAVLYARHLHAGVRQIAVWDGAAATASTAGTAVDLYAWQRAKLPQTLIDCGANTARAPLVPPAPFANGRRQSRAMLFGDVCGFSHLTDEQLPKFAAAVLGPIGAVIQRYADKIDLVNTWGDGIFVVFSDAGRAANCALEMQQTVSAVDLAAAGLPDTIQLRLGGHLGPVFEITDPILQRPNYYGAHVSRAARIEPIVPGGCVYVTETFAAVLALSNADELACDYVGWTEMAKNFGRLRMFLLRHRDGRLEPTVLSDIERSPVAA